MADQLLVAVGRRPALGALNLEAAGVQYTEEGITTDATLRTNVPHIWAAGDITSRYQFTHVASDQGKLVAHNVFAQKPQAFDDRVIPWVTFTDPELARVGLSEADLQEAKIEYRVGTRRFQQTRSRDRQRSDLWQCETPGGCGWQNTWRAYPRRERGRTDCTRGLRDAFWPDG